MLLALAKGHQPAAVDEDETAVGPKASVPLRRLLRYHVIENAASGDRFKVPLLERWVKAWAVIN